MSKGPNGLSLCAGVGLGWLVLILVSLAEGQDVALPAASQPLPSAIPQPSSPRTKLQSELEGAIELIRVESGVPAIWAGVFFCDGQQVVAASGVRKVGFPEEVTVNDLIHLGSCTKAMTAMLIAQQVSAGKLHWDATLGEIFNDIQGLAETQWRSVTVVELLQHRSGAPSNAAWWTLMRENADDVIASRRALLAWLLKQPPEGRAEYRYSNVGYALLGHILEVVEHRSWEELIKERLFVPLEMNSAGLGPVFGSGELDQPWGHIEETSSLASLGRLQSRLAGNEGQAMLKPIRSDNAPPLGPAGRVHMNLFDWSKFVRLFAAGAAPPEFLSIQPDDWRRLLETGEGEYMGGWLMKDRLWAGGQALTHSGSNTTWYCVAWVAPERGFCLLAATNSGTTQAATACDRATQKLLEIVRQLQ